MKMWLARLAVLALAASGCAVVRMDGPIAQSAGVEVTLPSQGATPVTFGLPLSAGSGPVTLRRVELVDVAGLEIVAIQACEGSPLTGDSYLNCAPTGGPWPPPNVALRDVAGTVIGSVHAEQAGLLFGAKLASGAQSGAAQGVRIFYAYAGVEYEVDEPWTLMITTP